MLLLQWCRTALVVAGFVWVMLAWYQYSAVATEDQRRVLALIDRLCANDSERDRDMCELAYRLGGLSGGSLSVNGDVSVRGEVDVSCH